MSPNKRLSAPPKPLTHIPTAPPASRSTTAAYRALNDPLRDLERTDPHPFPVTIAFLREAIGKLRAVGAQERTSSALNLLTLHN